MDQILISSREEYNLCVSRGYEPLLDNRFKMEIHLRVEIQREKFGRCVFGRGEDIAQANQRFFHWIWEHKAHICEETMRPLYNYSATYCSHILTRGSQPEMAHDPRNINILCFEMHNRWEHLDRQNMRIYEKNLETIKTLKEEYSRL